MQARVSRLLESPSSKSSFVERISPSLPSTRGRTNRRTYAAAAVRRASAVAVQDHNRSFRSRRVALAFADLRRRILIGFEICARRGRHARRKRFRKDGHRAAIIFFTIEHHPNGFRLSRRQIHVVRIDTDLANMRDLRPDLHPILKIRPARSAVASRISNRVIAGVPKRHDGLRLQRLGQRSAASALARRKYSSPPPRPNRSGDERSD